MKTKVSIITFLISLLGFSQNNITLKTGDIIFQSMDCGPLCDAINQVTKGYKGNDFSHLGMVYIKNDSVYVLEAAGEAVKITPLNVFRKYTDKPMFVGRLKTKYQKFIPDAIQFTLEQVGVLYDRAYLYDNGAYYCSELIYDAFLHAVGKPFFKLEPMTFKAPHSKEYFNVWEDYYTKLNMEIPEGQLGCNPGGISTSNKLKIIGKLY
jgi:hypothetical protein